MSYRNTTQADVLKLVAKKLQSSLAVEGELPEDGLAVRRQRDLDIWDRFANGGSGHWSSQATVRRLAQRHPTRGFLVLTQTAGPRRQITSSTRRDRATSSPLPEVSQRPFQKARCRARR